MEEVRRGTTKESVAHYSTLLLFAGESSWVPPGGFQEVTEEVNSVQLEVKGESLLIVFTCDLQPGPECIAEEPIVPSWSSSVHETCCEEPGGKN